MRNIVSLFAGGGLFTEGAKIAGLKPTGAIEIDAKKAEIYKLNHGENMDIVNILDVDNWDKFKDCWMLQASPPCKNSSGRKQHKNAEEKEKAFELDLRLACAVNRAIVSIKPRYFVLENVGGYAATEAYKMICQTLSRTGYTFTQLRLNSADFGVPQSRDRLYLIAALDCQVIQRLDVTPYFRPRIGWYAGLERHLTTCSKKILAPYQNRAIQLAFTAGKIAPNDIALLVGGAGSNAGKPGVTHWASPSPTVRSCEGMRSGGWRPVAVYKTEFFKPQGEAVGYKLSGRCLLALQGVPDSFEITNDVVTCFVAGNGVSVPVATAIARTIINCEAMAKFA